MKKINKITILVILTLFLQSCNKAKAVNKSETYAIIVAIEDYKYMTSTTGDLNYTVTDAKKFYNFLRSKKGGSVKKENILYLTESKASYSNIVYAGKKMFAKADYNDKVIFYFSGHGIKGAFVPYDAKRTYYGIDNMLYFSDLKEIFKQAKCKTKLLFADACFAGSTKTDLKKQVKKKLKKYKGYQAGIAFMMSCKDNETSIEFSKIQQGLFSYFLIHGLKGHADLNKDKKITIAELHKYVNKKVVRAANNRRHKQTPITFGKFKKNMVVAKLN